VTTTASLRQLVARLNDELRASYEPPHRHGPPSAEPLRDAYHRFGAAAAGLGISLEDAMAAGVEALQDLFERFGGQATDSTTIRGAGIALAALSRAYQDDAARRQRRPAPAPPTQVSRLEALYHINRAATANLQLGEMLDTIVRAVAETTGSDACAVFLFDAATDSLALRAAAGLNPAAVGAVTIRPGMGITGRAAVEGRVIAAPDAHRHESWLSYPVTGDDLYQTQVSVPMLLQGADQLVGVLNILTIARREFDAEEIAFLETVAGELAIAIENARLYSRTDARLRRKVTELGTLQRVSRTIASSLDLSEVLRSIAEQALQLIPAEAAAIFRLPHRVEAAGNAEPPVIEHYYGLRRDLEDNAPRDRLVREVVRTGNPMSADVSYADGTSPIFCLPLRSARETLGALCMRLRPGVELTEDELGLLQAFSDSASLAIENAQLYQDAMHGLDTTSALLQEMHHRVRNNLQTVAALLSLQLRQSEGEAWTVGLREAVSRVQAIAAVHDLLSDENRLGSTTIDMIARHVAEDAQSTLIPPGLDVVFSIPPSDVEVHSRQATLLALLINELVANAVSHGFAGRARGRVTIRAEREGELAIVRVSNDGHGIPAGFDPAQSTGLGMRIIQRLVTSDLHGEFIIRPTAEGTLATIAFRLTRPSLDAESDISPSAA